MPSSVTQDIVIIGAGLADLTLALSLHAEGISCTICDLRVPSRTVGGGLMLAPNALRVLDSLDIYSRLKPLGWSFETLSYKNENLETVGHYDFGVASKHGYQALRIFRETLLSEIRSAVNERGIPIHHGYHFSHVVSETAEGVTFAFDDGSTRTCSLLIGADGIHSTARKHVAPELAHGPKYLGLCGFTGAADRVNVAIPPGTEAEYDHAVTVQGKPGAFVFAPQNPDGGELFMGIQYPYPEQDHAGWSALLRNHDEMERIMRRDEAAWPEVAQSGLRHLKKESLNVWAYYTIPRLEHWTSAPGRVIILGDAAHAVPPTAGQGATQAFEDGCSLATLIGRLPADADWAASLGWWQGMRQERIDRVLELTARLNNARATKEEREKLPEDRLWQSEGQEDLGWLYNYRVKEDVTNRIEEGKKAGQA